MTGYNGPFPPPAPGASWNWKSRGRAYDALMRNLRHFDWEAGVVAGVAVVAIALHLLHRVEIELVLTVSMIALATLLIRDLAREHREEGAQQRIANIEASVARVERAAAPGAILVGPQDLRSATEQFMRSATGQITCFNVCLLMFRPQALFDLMLRPAIENPRVTAIQFVLDQRERERWTADVLPKIARCRGHAKVMDPRWCELNETVSFIVAHGEGSGQMEGQLSFWGEPFMAETPGGGVPRYIFHLPPGSPLIPQLMDLDRKYRMPS